MEESVIVPELYTWDSPFFLEKTIHLLIHFNRLDFDSDAALEAARIGKINRSISTEKVDLMIAGSTKSRVMILVSNDSIFSKLNGFHSENWV